MTLSEKSAYLKGLMDGLKLDKESDTGRLLAAVVDLLRDVTEEVDRLDELTLAISDELDEVEDDLDTLFDEDEDEDDYEDDFLDEDDEEPEDDDLEVYDSDEDTIYEVTCKCGEVIQFDEETLLSGGMICPNCGEKLEFSVDDDEDDEDDE